jgi:hypothetical protein
MRGRGETEAIRVMAEAEARPRQVRGETEAIRSRGRGDAETRLGRGESRGGDTKVEAEESRDEAEAMPKRGEALARGEVGIPILRPCLGRDKVEARSGRVEAM